MLPPKVLKFMDEISNGLDSSTAYDIFLALKHVSETLGFTLCISLLQVSYIYFFLYLIIYLFNY